MGAKRPPPEPEPPRLSPPWVAYVLHAKPRLWPKMMPPIITVLTGLVRNGRHLNFNYYNNGRDPHISIRTDGKSASLEAVIRDLRRQYRFRVSHQKYDEEIRIARTYEAATRLFLEWYRMRNDLALSDSDDRQHIGLFHGLLNNIMLDPADWEGHFWISLALAIGEGDPSGRGVVHVLIDTLAGFATDGEKRPAETVERLWAHLKGKQRLSWGRNLTPQKFQRAQAARKARK